MELGLIVGIIKMCSSGLLYGNFKKLILEPFIRSNVQVKNSILLLDNQGHPWFQLN